MKTTLLAVLTFLGAIAACGCYGQSFTSRTSLPAEARSSPVIFSIGGKVYVGGGDVKDFYVYDPNDGSWTPLGDIPGVNSSRSNSSAFVINGKAYMCLGLDGSTYKQDLWEYDPNIDHWEQKQAFPGGARAATFAFAVNGKGYVGGGVDANTVYGDLYSYDPDQDQWALIGVDPLGPTYFSSAFSLGGYGYLLGGSTPDGSGTGAMYRFDPDGGQWTPRATFIGEARSGASCFTLNDQAYYGMGNYNFIFTFADYYVYDPVGNSWTPVGTFPGGERAWAGTASTGTRAFVGLGSDQNYVLHNDWWEFTPAVGIEEEARGNADLQLFPIPATDAITIRNVSHRTGIVQVIDVEGRIVRSVSTSGEVQLDLSGLKPGSYEVRMLDPGMAPLHKRFVKL